MGEVTRVVHLSAPAFDHAAAG